MEISFCVRRFVFAYNTLLQLRQLDLPAPLVWTSKLVGCTCEAAGCSVCHFPKQSSFITQRACFARTSCDAARVLTDEVLFI